MIELLLKACNQKVRIYLVVLRSKEPAKVDLTERLCIKNARLVDQIRLRAPYFDQDVQRRHHQLVDIVRKHHLLHQIKEWIPYLFVNICRFVFPLELPKEVQEALLPVWGELAVLVLAYGLAYCLEQV